MEKKHKTILIIGIIVWIAGDIITTHVGFSLGIKEQNPFLIGKSIYEIAFLKISGAGILLICLKYLEKTETTSIKINRWKDRFVNHYPKGILIYGILIVVLNSIAIYEMIK